jgi:hypothetical protein
MDELLLIAGIGAVAAAIGGYVIAQSKNVPLGLAVFGVGLVIVIGWFGGSAPPGMNAIGYFFEAGGPMAILGSVVGGVVGYFIGHQQTGGK